MTTVCRCGHICDGAHVEDEMYCCYCLLPRLCGANGIYHGHFSERQVRSWLRLCKLCAYRESYRTRGCHTK
jgi:hypothetical protein